jgi:hypothetical protein
VKYTIVAYIALLVITSCAFAADRLVPSEYATVQAAIDAANPGDVVQISPGSYAGPIDTRGKSITVRGVGDPALTIISGGASVVRCVSGEGPTTLLQNLTVTGGTATPEISNLGGFPTVTMRGAGVKVIGSSPTFRNCRIVENRIEVSAPPEGHWCGFAAGLGAGVFVESGSPRFESCLIASNSIVSFSTCAPGGPTSMSDARGGGVCLIASGAALIDCLITGNSISASATRASTSGAGVHVSAGGSPSLTRCTVTSNSSTTSGNTSHGSCVAIGCGIAFETSATLVDSRVSENMMSGCGGNVSGVQFVAVGSTMSGTRICGNTGTQIAGAYANLGGNSLQSVCSTCAGDLNGDGMVNGADLGILLSVWGPCPN